MPKGNNFIPQRTNNETEIVMKHGYSILLFAAIISSRNLQAQYATNVLDVNDVNARFQSNGHMGISGPLGGAFGGSHYYVPSTPNTGPSPLFAASMWIGGLDSSGALHLAAERFEGVGTDYYPGPLGTNTTVTQSISTHYDQLWKVDRSDVLRQIAYFNCLNDPNCDAQVEFPGYIVPASFYGWPAHGDVSLGQAYNLADFYDYNGDGQYNPDEGDAPCVPGDQALFSIYNDNLTTHDESGGQPIGLEVHYTPFAFASGDPAVNQTIFIRYQLINRSSFTLHATYVGFWNDYNLGGAIDDYVQCDVGRNLFYVFNGDSIDQDANGIPGYGAQPPAFGEAFLKGPLLDPDGLDNTEVATLPGYNGTGFNDGIVDNERFGMSHFLYHRKNSNAPNADPTSAMGFYAYLKGEWQDGVPLTYGGNGYSIDTATVPAQFMFPGDSDPLGAGTGGQVMPPWTEQTSGNPPGDRRGIASMGPFTFSPGQMQEIVVAYIYARAGSGGPEASAEALKLRTDSIRAFAQTIPGLLGEGSPCDGLITGITTKGSKDLGLLLYPNPANDRLHVVLPSPANHATIVVFDAQGALVMTQEVNSKEKHIDVTKLSSGLYLARVQSGGKNYSRAFVKQ